jgi:alpha-glutamyl/putrescinyl thymine pyrophosphorylase clade 1
VVFFVWVHSGAKTRGVTMTLNTAQLLYWVKEREAIRVRRANGEPFPWTGDEILKKWSFCNVRREADRTTRWIAENWRAPHADDPDLWFAIVIARFVNWPDTLAALGYPLPWDPEFFLKVTNARKVRDEICFGPAYNISNGGKKTSKPEYLVQGVFAPLWGPLTRKRLRPRDDDSLHSFYGRLKAMPGFGSFMAGQVVADVKYVAPLKYAPDWFTFAVPGPGSKRGLNRVLGRPVDAPWRDDDTWRAAFHRLREQIMPEPARIDLGDLHAADLQNCLCEMDKFERARLGEGKPKRRFVPRG